MRSAGALTEDQYYRLKKGRDVMNASLSGKMFSVFNYLLLAILGILCVYPFYFIIVYSLSDPKAVLSSPAYLFPKGFTLVNYQTIFSQNDVLGPFFISTSRTVIGTLLTLIGCSMFAYGLTKKETPMRKFMYVVLVFTMYIRAGLIPGYLLIKELSMLNSFLVYIIPGMINAFFLILIKTFFEQLPLELEEAAVIEGAGYFRIFWSIVVPLSKPILATIAIFAAVGQWNSWMDNLLYNSSQSLLTLQFMLLKFLQTQSYSMKDAAMMASMGKEAFNITPQSIRMAITVIVILPVLVVYPFLQRYFVKGIMIGAVKG